MPRKKITQDANTSGSAGRKQPKKATRKRAGKKAKQSKRRRSAERPASDDAPTTGIALHRALAARGFLGSPQTLYRLLAGAACPFEKPRPDQPVDVDGLAQWIRVHRPKHWDFGDQSTADADENGADPGTATPAAIGSDSDDPYEPPPPAVLERIRNQDPGEWALFLQRLRAAEARRIANDRARAELLPRSEVEAQHVARITAVRSAMRQLPRPVASQVADLVAERIREAVPNEHAEAVSRACGRMESEIEQLLSEALKTTIQIFAGDQGRDDGQG